MRRGKLPSTPPAAAALLLPIFLCLLSRLSLPATAAMGGGSFLQVHDPSDGHPNSLNCTWKFISQPVDHFASASGGATFQECVYLPHPFAPTA